MAATESIVLIRFPQPSRAYQAASELRGLGESLTNVKLRGAALVERTPEGKTALIIDAVKSSPEPLDQLATRFEATIERQPAAQVVAEAETAQLATKATQREAARVLRQHKRAETHAKIEQKVGAVKDKLHQH